MKIESKGKVVSLPQAPQTAVTIFGKKYSGLPVGTESISSSSKAQPFLVNLRIGTTRESILKIYHLNKLLFYGTRGFELVVFILTKRSRGVHSLHWTHDVGIPAGFYLSLLLFKLVYLMSQVLMHSLGVLRS